MKEILNKMKNWISKKPWVLLLVWILLPLVFSSKDYLMHIFIMIAIYVILSQGINIVLGFCGQSMLGFAAFFGIGAYISGMLTTFLGWNFWITLVLAFAGASLIGIIIGLPSTRVRGDYLGIVTLGFGEITRIILTNWDSLTNGPMGISGIKAPTLFGFSLSSKIVFFYMVTLMAGLTWFIMNRLIVSKFGFQLIAVRNDENAAEVLGINTGRVKVMSYSLSAGFAGIAGALYSSYFSFISPDSFIFNDSLTILCMVVVGGMGNLTGSVIGAILLTITPELFRFLGDYRMMLYGIVLSVMVIFKPMGIWGMDKRKRNAIVDTCGERTNKSRRGMIA
jgi:branched-chain amino acid transport system permease protein